MVVWFSEFHEFPAGDTMIDQEISRALLAFVRAAARDELEGTRRASPPDGVREIPYGGVFVTLKREGQLRGCMGRLRAGGPLIESLADVTVSALHDPRFTEDHITAGELPELDIEVSILTQVVRVFDPAGLVAGRHGVVITRSGRSGCFLPQVASEHNWSIERFLSECCRMKAGLAEDAWRDPETLVESFEVQILRERDA